MKLGIAALLLLVAGCGGSPRAAGSSAGSADRHGPAVISDPGWPDLDGDGRGERLEIDRPAGRGTCSVPDHEEPGWFPRNVTVTVEGTAGERLAGPILLDGVLGFEPPPANEGSGEPPPCSGVVSGPWNHRESIGGVLLRSLEPNAGFEVVFAAMRSTCSGPCGLAGSSACDCEVEATYVESHQFAHGAPMDTGQRRVDDDAGVLRVRADCGATCRLLAVATSLDGGASGPFLPGPGPHRADRRSFGRRLEDVQADTSDGQSGVRLPPGRHVVWVFDEGRPPMAFEVSAPQDHGDVTLVTSGGT